MPRWAGNRAAPHPEIRCRAIGAAARDLRPAPTVVTDASYVHDTARDGPRLARFWFGAGPGWRSLLCLGSRYQAWGHSNPRCCRLWRAASQYLFADYLRKGVCNASSHCWLYPDCQWRCAGVCEFFVWQAKSFTFCGIGRRSRCVLHIGHIYVIIRNFRNICAVRQYLNDL